MSKRCNVLLVDDHALMREMLSERLANEPDLDVIGAAENADLAVAEAVRLQPDIIIMDIDMPGLHCFDATRTIQARCPDTKIIILSAFFHDHYIEQALAAEAVGYLTKNESVDMIIDAIRDVAAGGSHFSPEVRARIVVDSGGTRLATQRRSRVSTLTPREMEVLRYVARGLSQKQVAETMHLSVKTVHCHCTNLMTKLDIHDRVELARFAIREGLAEA
jgi:DNA-binding NarL/FixJ family response regulator